MVLRTLELHAPRSCRRASVALESVVLELPNRTPEGRPQH
jgi:hypothetical protein